MCARITTAARRTCVAAVAFVAAVLCTGTTPAVADTDILDEIATSWAADPVYVHPPMRIGFPAAELRRIRTTAASAGMPVYVALVPDTTVIADARADLPTLLHARIGRPGLYLVWIVDDDRWYGTEDLVLAPGRDGERLLSGVKSDDDEDQQLRSDAPAPGIVRRIQQAQRAANGTALPAIPVADKRERYARGPRGLSHSDKEDRALYVGLGVGGTAGLVAPLWFGIRRWPARRATGQLPAIRALRRNADGQLAKATQSLHALERRIDRAEPDTADLSELLDRRDDASRRLTAARLLRAAGDDDRCAAAGAAVLARQAHQLSTGRPDASRWVPCFFDPRHAGGTRATSWSGDDTTGAQVEVPACPQCVKAVARDREPRSFLVPDRRRLRPDGPAVPYWTRGADDPFAATGFGALTDDLAERVQATYGGAR